MTKRLQQSAKACAGSTVSTGLMAVCALLLKSLLPLVTALVISQSANAAASGTPQSLDQALQVICTSDGAKIRSNSDAAAPSPLANHVANHCDLCLQGSPAPFLKAEAPVLAANWELQQNVVRPRPSQVPYGTVLRPAHAPRAPPRY